MQKPSPASGARPELLFVSPEAPWPTIGGGATRTASLLEYLVPRFAIDLILFAEKGSPDPAGVVPPGLVRGVHTMWLPRHGRSAGARVARNLHRYVRRMPPLLDRFAGFEAHFADFLDGRRYHTAVIEHFWCARYVDLLRRHAEHVWLDLHNVESVWHRRLAEDERWPLRTALRHFADDCLAAERRLLPRFSGILVPSESDACAIASAAGSAPITAYPNALPWVDPPPRSEEDVVVFTGNLEYAPNVRAIGWFLRNVWPSLRLTSPSLIWRIVGRNPRGISGRIGDDSRVQLIGPVENAIAEIARAKVAVVPLLAGSGTRFKIVEAWAAGTPVVSTTIGAEGLNAVHGKHILIADTPSQMCETIALLLRSDERRRELASAGRDLYEKCFTWTAAWRTLESSGLAGSETTGRAIY